MNKLPSRTQFPQKSLFAKGNKQILLNCFKFINFFYKIN